MYSVIVYRLRKPDQRLKRLPFAMLLLAIAVFGWGLHYKLTLYQQGAEVRVSEPAAKLLSERERPTENATNDCSQLHAINMRILQM